MGRYRTPVAKNLSGLIIEHGEWQLLALCRKVPMPDIIFDASHDGSGHPDPDTLASVRALCNQCPVKDICLQAGMDEAYGIWGGRTAAERRTMRRTQRG